MYQIPRLRHLHLQTTTNLMSCTRFHAFDTSTVKQHHISYHAADSTPSTPAPSNNTKSHIMHQIPRLRHLHLQTTHQHAYLLTHLLSSHYCTVWGKWVVTQEVAWLSDRTSVFGRRTFSVLRSTCNWRVTTYVGKPSTMGQPTRPTQPFIPSGSIDK